MALQDGWVREFVAVGRGVDETGRDRVHKDAVGCEFDRERAGERAHARLGHVVRSYPVAGPLGPGRADAYDPGRGSGAEQVPGAADKAHDRQDIDIQVPAPVLVADAQRRAVSPRGRVVDEAVKAAVAVARPPDEPLALTWIAQIAFDDIPVVPVA